MMGNLLRGAAYGWRGVGLIMRPGARRFVVVPLLINTLLYAMAIGFIWGRIDAGRALLEQWIPGWLEWISWLLYPLVAVTLVLIVWYGFFLLASFIAAPFNALLAEKLESILRGAPVPPGGGLKAVPRMALRTILSEVRKLLYQALWLVPLVILMLIPGLNILSPAAWFLFGAWMMAVNTLDYPMGNHDLYFAEVRRRMRRDRLAAIGFGGAILLLVMVPVLNFIAIPVGVAGATAMWVERISGAGESRDGG